MTRAAAALVVLLLLSAAAAAVAALTDAEAARLEEAKRAKVQVTYSDGHKEEVTAEEMSKRMIRSEKARQVLTKPDKTEIEESTAKLSDIEKDKPALNNFIKRGRPIADTPKGEEYLVLRLQGFQYAGIEVHAGYTRDSVYLIEAWWLDAKDARLDSVPLPADLLQERAGGSAGSDSWLDWLLYDPALGAQLPLITVAVGATLIAMGIAGLFLAQQSQQ